ncbi:MAG: cobalamin-binding protein [Pirellulales bacterium]
MTSIPRRIVCLSAEAVDLFYRLGAQELVIGVSAFTQFPPEARSKVFVSGFTTIRYDVIESLKPDLVIGFSDLQADALRELAKRGYPVLLTNQRTLEEMFATITMLGRIVGKAAEAESLVCELQSRLEDARQTSRRWKRRPKVYFEEWDDPLITGIAWIGELIEAAGGEDAFGELGRLRTASERVIQAEAVIERAPDIIIASWCGKKANQEAIRARPGWEAIPAIHDQELHEIKSEYCLQPGPVLIAEGLPRFSAIVGNWHAKSGNR